MIDALKIILNQVREGDIEVDDAIIVITELYNKPNTYIQYPQIYWTDKTYPKYEVTCSDGNTVSKV